MLLLEVVNPQSLNSSMMMYQIIAIVVSGFLGWGTSMINGRQERKKIRLETSENNKKISERDALLLDQMRGFDNKLVELSMRFLEFSENSNFKARLMNSMRSIATNMIDYNVDLQPKYKHIFMLMAKEFEDFALRFYYSDMRGVSHEISSYLRIDMDSRVSKFETYFEHLKSKPKKFVYSTGKKVKLEFVEYVDKSGLKNRIEVLIMVLEKNGLSPDDVIVEFEKFMSEFFKIYIHVVNEWEDLQDYVNVVESSVNLD